MVSTTRRSATRESKPFKKFEPGFKDEALKVKEDYNEYNN